MVVVLPTPLTPTIKITSGRPGGGCLGSGRRPPFGLSRAARISCSTALQLASLHKLATADLLAKVSQNILRRLYAKISGDERGFELIQDAGINLFLALDNALNPFD